MKKLLVTGGCIAIGVILAITAYVASGVASCDEKKMQETRMEKLQKKAEKLEKKETPTQNEKIELGETLVEIANIEEKYHPEEYYKDHIDSLISSVGAAVEDMKLDRKRGVVPKEKVEECNGRIADFGSLIEQLKAELSAKSYTSYEDLYKTYHTKYTTIVEKYQK